MPVTPLHISFLCAFVQTWIYTHPYAKNRSFKSSRSRKQWQRMKGSKNDWEEKKNNTLIYSPRKWNVQARKRSGLSAIQGLGTRIPPSPFLPCVGPMGSQEHCQQIFARSECSAGKRSYQDRWPSYVWVSLTSSLWAKWCFPSSTPPNPIQKDPTNSSPAPPLKAPLPPPSELSLLTLGA